jgi:hypothetical protein
MITAAVLVVALVAVAFWRVALRILLVIVLMLILLGITDVVRVLNAPEQAPSSAASTEVRVLT